MTTEEALFYSSPVDTISICNCEIHFKGED
ncbi:unnamed protein product [Cuscuta epithymum]|uniref:Uncharacterized protein n=1 Tax=Cuscuta epithymum TaxID=186058 RepID=A0AAV0G1D7_9ASTE|nr:unnamed protein product [Cuscuta epithymum]